MKYFVLLFFVNFLFSQNADKEGFKVNDSLVDMRDYSVEELESIYKSLGLRYGDKVTVIVLFKVDENGDVIINKIKSPHNAFTKEAIEIFKKLPKFDPPKDRNGKPMGVNFSQPISFILKDETKKKIKKENDKKASN